jgi:modulator of FtsH protease HflK
MGDANRFSAVFTEYARAPEITRRRLYMETMTEVLPRMGRKVILDDSARNVLPFLPLNADLVPPPAPATTANPAR